MKKGAGRSGRRLHLQCWGEISAGKVGKAAFCLLLARINVTGRHLKQNDSSPTSYPTAKLNLHIFQVHIEL